VALFCLSFAGGRGQAAPAPAPASADPAGIGISVPPDLAAVDPKGSDPLASWDPQVRAEGIDTESQSDAGDVTDLSGTDLTNTDSTNTEVIDVDATDVDATDAKSAEASAADAFKADAAEAIDAANTINAMGGGLPSQGYYTYIDSDEPANPPAVIPPPFNFKDIRFGSTVTALGDDDCVGPIPLSGGGDRPDFEFTYFDSNVANEYTEVYVCSNGNVSFGAPFTTFSNSCPVGGGVAGGQIHAFWDDLNPTLGSSARILYKTVGSVPFRSFIVQWEQVAHFGDGADNVIVQLQLEEFTDDIRVQYFNVFSGAPDGLALSTAGDILAGSSVGHKILRYAGGSAFSANHVRSREGGLLTPAGLTIGNGIDGDAVGDVDGDGVDDLYVSSSASNEILVYSGVTGTGQINDGSLLAKLVTDLPGIPGDETGGLSTPRGLSFGPDGNLYVASFGTNSIKRYDGVSGLYLGDFVSAGLGGLNGPDGLVFGPDGSLYVASFNNDRVLRYNGATGALIGTFVAAGSGGLDGPRGIVFGPDGNLYVASENTDEVLRYLGATGALLGTVVTAGQNGLDRPRGLAFGPIASPPVDTELYVAGFGSNQVHVYDPALSLTGAGAPGMGPRGAIIGPSGELLVADYANNRILRFNAATGAYNGLLVAGGESLNGPYDMAVSGGQLYVSNYNNDRVLRLVAGNWVNFVWDDPLTIFTDESGGLNEPRGLGFFGGNLYVTSSSNHIKRYNGAGTYIGDIVSIANPWDLVISGPNLYVTAGNLLRRYDAATGSGGTTLVGAGLSNPFQLLVYPDGATLAVADAGTNRVLAFDLATGSPRGEIVSAVDGDSGAGLNRLNGPIGLAPSSDGGLFVTGSTSLRLYRTVASSVRNLSAGGASNAGVSASVGLSGPSAPPPFLPTPLALNYGCNSAFLHDNLAVLFEAPPPPGADIEILEKRVDDPEPCEDQVITFEIDVINNGRFTATGVTVVDPMPPGLTYEGSWSATQGTYDGTTWTVGTLLRDQVETLTVMARVDQDTAATPGRFKNEFVLANGEPPPATTPFGRLIEPTDIVWHAASSRFLIASKGSNSILKYTAAGVFDDYLVRDNPGTAFDETEGLRGPTGLALDPSGASLYVSSFVNNQILRYNATTGASEGIVVEFDPATLYPNGLFGPIGLIFDSSGRLLAASSQTNRVLRYRQDPPLSGTWVFDKVVAGAYNDPNPAVASAFDQSPLAFPHDMVFGPDRSGDAIPDLYVSSRGSSHILVFDVNVPTPNYVGALAGAADGISAPTGLVFSPDNRYLLVSSGGTDSVLALDAGNGTPIWSWVAAGEGGLSTPDGIIFVPGSNELLVASTSSHQVLRYTARPSGQLVRTVDSGSDLNAVHPVHINSSGDTYIGGVVGGNLRVRRYAQGLDEFLGNFVDDVDIGDEVCIATGSVSSVLGLAVTSDGERLYASVQLSCDFIFPSSSQVVVLGGPQASGSTGPGQYIGTLSPAYEISDARYTGLTIGPDDLLYASVDDFSPFFLPQFDRIHRFIAETGVYLGVFASGSGLSSPQGLVFGPDFNPPAPPAVGDPDLYVASEGSNQVKAYDGQSGAFLGNVINESTPVGVAYGPDGDLYAASRGNGRIVRRNSQTAVVSVLASGIPDARGLAAAPNGDLYVAGQSGRFLRRYEGGASYVGVFAAVSPEGLNCGQYLTFGPDRTADGFADLYVASEFSDDIKLYDGQSGAFIQVFASTPDLDGPRDLVFGPDGWLYVSSFNNDRVLRFNATTGAYEGSPFIPNPQLLIWESLFGFDADGGLEGPEGLAFGPDDGLLYVASNQGNQILRYYNGSGIFRGIPVGYPGSIPFVDVGGTPSLSAPRSMEFGTDGSLYVTVPGAVYRYDGATGQFLGIFTQGGSLAGASDLVFGPDGRLYVVSNGSGEVMQYQGLDEANPGKFIKSFLITEPGEPKPVLPVGLAFGPTGDLFVSSCGSHNVIRYCGFIANVATGQGNSSPAVTPSDPKLSNNSRGRAIFVRGADLDISKSVDKRTPLEGETVTYKISLLNRGPKDAIDVQAIDSFSHPGTIAITGSSPSQGSFDSGTGIWTVGPIPALDPNIPEEDQAVTLLITGVIQPGAAQVTPIMTNTVTVDDLSPSIGDPDRRNNTAEAPVFLEFADLVLTKVADKPQIEEGETVRFTLTISNTGRNVADLVRVRDRLPTGLAYAGSTASVGSYSPLTGIWEVGTLAVYSGGSPVETLEIDATAVSGTGGMTVTNRASIARSSMPDPNDQNQGVDNNNPEVEVGILGADLEVLKTVTPGPYFVGQSMVFTIVVTNLGPKTALSTVVNDKLPTGLQHLSNDGGGAYQPSTGIWVVGDLLNGASATLNITARLLPGYAGIDLFNTASASSATGDIDSRNNQSTVRVGAPAVDLSVVKSARPWPAVAGEPLFYEVVVTNSGRSDALNVVLTDTLAADVRFIRDDNLERYNIVGSTPPTLGSRAQPCIELPVGSGMLTCNLGIVAAGERRVITIQTAVHPFAYVDRLTAGEPLSLRNDAAAQSSDLDLRPADNLTTQLTLLRDIADLSIFVVAADQAPRPGRGTFEEPTALTDLASLNSMDAPLAGGGQVRAGEVFTYTTVVENLGPSAARGVAITDTLLSNGSFELVQLIPDPLRNDVCDTVSAPAPQSGELIRCRLEEPLEPLGSGLGTGRWTVQVVVRALQTQDINHIVRVYSRDTDRRISGTHDPDLRNNSAQVEVAILDTANLGLGMAAIGNLHDPTSCGTVTPTLDQVTAGDQLTYVLVAQNQAPAFGEPGGSTATNVLMLDSLPKGVELVSVSATGPAGAAGCLPGTPGQPRDPTRCQIPALEVGQSATMTIVVLVGPDYVGQSETNLLQNDAWVVADEIDPDFSDNLATRSVQVSELADLVVEKLARPTSVVAGEALSYEIIVANRGPSTSRNVLVRDQLPPEVNFVSARIEQMRDRESCTYNAGAHQVICSLLDVPPGEPPVGQRRVFIETRVAPDAAVGPIQNQVTVSSQQTPDCDPSNNVDIQATAVSGRRADVAIHKTSNPLKVFAGEQKHYEIWVENLGPSEAEDVTVYDILPDEAIYEVDTSSPMCTQPAGLVAWRAILNGANEVPPVAATGMGLATFVLESATNELSYAVQLNDLGSPGPAVTGIHIHSGAAGVNGPIQVTLYSGGAPSPSPTEPLQGRITLPPATAAAIAANPAAFYVNVHTTANPAGAIRGQLAETRNAPLHCPIGVLAAGQSVHFDIWAYIRPETLAGTTITNVAMVNSFSSLGDPDLTNNVDSSKNLVLGKSDLRVVKFGKNDGQVRAGEILTYTILVDNLGPSYAEGVALKDVFQTAGVFDLIDIASDRPARCRTLPARGDQPPAGIGLPAQPWPVTSAPPAFGVLDPTGIGNIDQRLEMDCELTEVISPDPDVTTPQLAVLAATGPQNPGRWIMTVRFRARQAQDVNNIVDVLSSGLDPNLDNNHAEVSHEITDVADLRVVKSSVGEVQVDGQPGDIYDPAAPAAFPQAPGYTTAPDAATAGRRIRYTIDIVNDGPSDAENVWLTDRLPAGVTLLPGTLSVSARGQALPAGSCQTGTPGEVSDQLRCGLGTLAGAVAPGTTARVTFDVLVDSSIPAGAVLENDVRVSSDVFDPDSSDDQDYAQTTIRASADLALSKTAVGQNVTGYNTALGQFIITDQADRVTAGLLLRYRIQVQNEGPSDAAYVLLRDRLPAGLTLQRVEGASCRADSVNQGILYCTLPRLVAGARATFDLWLRVAPSLPQGTILTNCVDGLTAASSPPGQPPALPGLPPGLPLTPDPFATNSDNICQNTTVNAVADVGGPDGPFGPDLGRDGFISKRDIPAQPRLDMPIEPDLALAGREHRYLIEFGNAGPSSALNVTVNDLLDFKQTGIPGETFLRCEPADPDDLVTCVYDPATHSVRLQSLSDHNESIFAGGLGSLQPGLLYRFYLITMVDSGYVLDASNTIAEAANSEPGVIARDTVRIATSTTDFHAANDLDTERTKIIAEADLRLTKTDIFGDPVADPDTAFLSCDPVVPGGMITYDLRVDNLGPSDAAEVFVVDWLPTEFVVADPAQVVVTVSAGEVVEVRDDGRITVRLGNDVNNAGAAELGRINAGSSASIRIQVMVRLDAPCGSQVLNQAYVETRRNDARWPLAIQGPAAGNPKGAPLGPRTPTYDPVPSNDADSETTTIECPSIAVNKTVSFDGQCPGRDVTLINEPGQPVTFCFEITNTGTTYLDNIMVTDTLKTFRGMPTVVYTDTITFGTDPKVPVAPGETVLRQVTVPHLTRECGNVTDTVEVSANPVNAGRTDLPCLPLVEDSDTANIEVPCLGVDFRLQLPIIGNSECEAWLQVQNVGDKETIALIVAWGDPGFCPPQASGPLKAECSGLLRPGSAWSFAAGQLPVGTKSAVAYSLSAEIVEPERGQRIPFGLLVCDEVFRVAGDHLAWLLFDTAYRQRGTWGEFDFGAYQGEPLAISVNRRCPDPVNPGASVNAAYIGISSDMGGAYDPKFGGYTYYAPMVFASRAGLNSTLHIQNAGGLCSSLEIWFKGQDNCLRPILGDVLSLAPGETVSFDASSIVGPDWLGSAWIRGTQPMAIIVDTFGANHFTSYAAVPGDVAELDFSLGDQINFGPLIYSEHQGWDTILQVQNLSATLNAKVKVYFLDRSGDIKTTLVDWICPRGSQTFFTPVVAGLPGNWVGSVRVESQDWWTAGTNPQDAPRIQSVVLLERWSDPARTTRREAVAYNAHTETIYDWQVGNRKGGVTDGSAVFAVPFLSKGNRGVNSEIAITNVVPKPGFTDFAIFIYDQNGLIDFVCEKLHDRQVEYIDLSTWGVVPTNFLGSMVVSATFWEHDVFDGQGNFVRNLVGLSGVAVERVGGTSADGDIPGDESKAFEAFPLFDFFLKEQRPQCPGVPPGLPRR
jgi:uncharacterized repeat protein (TIGR01451 family)